MMKRIFHGAIICFCCWHMAAIALYALPTDAKDPWTTGLRENLSPMTRPYVLILSLWQQWNMFAPDPLSRITEYGIELKQDGEWMQIARLKPGTFPWWRHTAESKMLDRLLEQKDGLKPLREHLLLSFCHEKDLKPGSELRLTYHTALLPKNDRVRPVSFWRTWNPEWTSAPDVSIHCR